MSDKTKNIIILVEAMAVVVLSAVVLFQIFPQTMRKVAEVVGVFAILVFFAGLQIWANDSDEKRDPDTY